MYHARYLNALETAFLESNFHKHLSSARIIDLLVISSCKYYLLLLAAQFQTIFESIRQTIKSYPKIYIFMKVVFGWESSS